MKNQYLKKLLLLLPIIFILSACGKKQEETSNQNYSFTIDKTSKDHFEVGDTLEIYGKHFGSGRGFNFVVFRGSDVAKDGYAEVDESGYLVWSDSIIKIVVPDGAVEGQMFISNKMSNSYGFRIKRPLMVEIIDWLIKVSLGITLLFIYLKINKIWKRKHEREVADSQSLTGLAIYVANCVLWVSYYTFVENDLKSLIDTSVYIFEGTIFFIIGTGVFVRGQTKTALWELIKRALKLERKEADYLLKRFFKPSNPETIINILHQIAMIDNEFDPKEHQLILAFANQWNIEYNIDKYNKESKGNSENQYMRLRKSVENYLDREPPREQVAQLKDLITTMIEADEKVTDEEALISSELLPMIENYLKFDQKVQLFQVLIVQQKPEHYDAIQELLPHAKKINTAGGIAYSVGKYYSDSYAEMICKEYRDINFFTIVYSPREEELV
jgi:hypothetical protein